MVNQNHSAADKLGDPDFILDDPEVVEGDKKARSQIKGKSGKNSKIKSSNGIHISKSGNAAGPSKGPQSLDTIVIDPNLVLDDIEMTDHEIIDKLGDPTLVFDQMGTHHPSPAPNDDVAMAMDETDDGLFF